MSTEAPKRKKNASKKNKKSWRKNVDIDDVEEFLEDERLEQRIGGKFDDRKDEELFIVDNAVQKEDGAEKIPDRLQRRKAKAQKPLKCFQHLEITTGVPDPITKRNRVRSREERKNPTVVKKEEEMKRKGIKKAKEIQALKNRQAALADKKASTLERSTRRRTKFDFDLWDVGSCASRSETGEKLQDSTWLNHNTRMHNLKSTRSLKRKVPQDFRREISTRTKVETPHAGASYNPSYADHQDLLWKAALVEVNKEKAAQKIEYHTTRMFPDAKDAPTMADHIKEMSEGIRELEGDKEEEDDDDEEYEDIESGAEKEEESGGNKKLKTRKQRRKEKEAKADLAVRKRAADDMKKNQDVYRLKSLKKSISVSEAVTATRVVKRLQAKVDKLGEPAKLSKHTFEDADMEIKLSDELTGNLRSLKPEGNLLEDRFKSMQARNVIETRIKTKIVKNPKKRKRLEKRNYKMPWEKDAHGIVKA